MERVKKEIRLSGSGGQGLITAGIILARAAIIDGVNVTQTQSYGPESRGGASRADVIISNEEIDFPEATRFDVLLALTQEACDKYLSNTRSNGIVIVDTSFVKNVTFLEGTTYEHPFTNIAIEKLGSALPANILSLAFLVKVTKVVSTSSLKKAVEKSMKPAFADLNNKAMKIGFDLADKVIKGRVK